MTLSVKSIEENSTSSVGDSIVMLNQTEREIVALARAAGRRANGRHARCDSHLSKVVIGFALALILRSLDTLSTASC